MSPASYQTAPPRTWMLSRALPQQQQQPSRPLRGRRRRGCRATPLDQAVGLLDGVLGRVDLRLIAGQVALLEELLGLLEVLESKAQQVRDGGSRRAASRRRSRGPSERYVQGV